ncbi:hypothetical protein FHT67_000395 [Paenibacillus sp. BK720]|nr:hypothetical protein [Paenibacillus sp. BK720]
MTRKVEQLAYKAIRKEKEAATGDYKKKEIRRKKAAASDIRSVIFSPDGQPLFVHVMDLFA